MGIARGNEKGRVERKIRDIRESFFAARSYGSLADLNRQLDTWLARVVHQRRVPGDADKLVSQALAEEQDRLLKLPEHPFSPVRRWFRKPERATHPNLAVHRTNRPAQLRMASALLAKTSGAFLRGPGATRVPDIGLRARIVDDARAELGCLTLRMKPGVNAPHVNANLCLLRDRMFELHGLSRLLLTVTRCLLYPA